MDNMTVTEMMDYVEDIDLEGITLTEAGRNAAITILSGRKDWTNTHRLMYDRLMEGIQKMPHKLARTVNRTRLGMAIELGRKLTKVERRKQKQNRRRKALKVRRAARKAEGVAA